MTDPKCDACNLIETLSPCGFCNQPVVMRYNTMTGEHYISHEDWNSRCPQRPFYGSSEQWNVRVREAALRAENERLNGLLCDVRERTTTFYCPGCGQETGVAMIEHILPSVMPCQCPMCGMWWRIEIKFWPTTPKLNFERDGDA